MSHISHSSSVVQALDNIRGALENLNVAGTGIYFQQLANGPFEQVLVFNSDDQIFLNANANPPFFHSTGQGILTDLYGKALPGSKGLSSLPVDPSELDDATQWPPKQPEPFNAPPVNNEHTTRIGFAKNFISFGDGSSLGTVGASLAKILRLKNGGAQFWESSVQAVCESSGRYEGARGMLVFGGSAYFPVWPDSSADQIKLLSAGFPARLVRCFKLVLRPDQK